MTSIEVSEFYIELQKKSHTEIRDMETIFKEKCDLGAEICLKIQNIEKYYRGMKDGLYKKN